MPKFKGQFISLVFIGRHNPQILNHDFLTQHNVIPKEEEPFKTLFKKQPLKPFSEFVSSPVVTSIRYGPVAILVDENRYQIRDERFAFDSTSPILEITKTYFGDLLKYTPLVMGGMNINGQLIFDDEIELAPCIERLVKQEAISEMSESDTTFIGLEINFPWLKGVMQIKLSSSKEGNAPRDLNFNYEFKYRDMESFLGNLEAWPEFSTKAESILTYLKIGL